MKKTCLIIVVIASSVFVGASIDENERDRDAIANVDLEAQICEPNSITMKDCNRCKCSTNGRLWLCTKKLCPKFRAIVHPTEPNFICTPNKVFRYECNNCTCNSNGQGAICTEIPCLKDKFILHERIAITTTTTTERSDSQDKCTPGSRWKNDCNWCFCTETGIGVCTLKGCLGNVDLSNIRNSINNVRKKRQTINQHQATTVGEVIYTLEDLNKPDFSCTPSLSFKVDCNTCWCAADGKRPRFCTRIACNPKFTPTTQKTKTDTKGPQNYPKNPINPTVVKYNENQNLQPIHFPRN